MELKRVSFFFDTCTYKICLFIYVCATIRLLHVAPVAAYCCTTGVSYNRKFVNYYIIFITFRGVGDVTIRNMY